MSYSIEERRKYDTERCRARRKYLENLLGSRCVMCGATIDLHFDHVDPKGKSFTISNHLTKPLHKLEEELKKCQLLCGPCHRKKTSENRDHGLPLLRHGTIHMYQNKKCRCEECKVAQRIWLKDYRQRKKRVSSKG